MSRIALLRLYKNDLYIKRTLIKTIAWASISTMVAFFTAYLMSSDLSLGIKLSIPGFIATLILYFFHESTWQRVGFGLPSKRQQLESIKKEIKPSLSKHGSKISRT